MPKQIINYSKTIIYKIVCKDININDLYIGHTTNFTKRKNQHKYCCNNRNHKDFNLNVYQFIRNNDGWENFDMIEIEKFNCNDKLEACKRERYWVETLKASLNKQVPSRNKDEYIKQYRIEKADIIKKQAEEYRLKNRDKILKQKHINYQENKEKILDYAKQYYVKNKEVILQKQKQMIHCDICNCEVRKCSLNRHCQSIKHRNNSIMKKA
jgi:predicted GIY-YIG superfamily endonuclease